MNFDWTYVYSLLWDADFWMACWTVVKLSVIAWVTAVILGFGLALAKQSALFPLRAGAKVYIWFFRSLPLLVLLVFVYNFPQVVPSSSWMLSNPFYAGLIALILSETAYMAEIHRGGILSVPKGQYEAGKALGIQYTGIQRLIVIPQAIRIALPTLSNEFVTIVKLTSLVSVISLTEILLVGQRLYTQNFLVFETMLAVAFYYILIVTLFDKLLILLESTLDISRRKPKAFALSAQDRTTIEDAQKNASGMLAHDRDGSTPALQARHIQKTYDQHIALKGIDLTVNMGDVISVIGPSGSGKTSLIRALNGLETIDQGTISLDGQPFLGDDVKGDDPAQRHQILHIGMVFQSFNLFPHKTVLQNILLAPRYHQRANAKVLRVDALAMLLKVGMLEHANKYPHQLSGGQQQRVAIARALAMKPSIMLFDEPTSALDPELVNEVLKVVEQLAKEGMTMLIVTHEMHFAFKVSNRVLFMEEGAVVYDSTPEKLLASDDQRVKDFLHQVNH